MLDKTHGEQWRQICPGQWKSSTLAWTTTALLLSSFSSVDAEWWPRSKPTALKPAPAAAAPAPVQETGFVATVRRLMSDAQAAASRGEIDKAISLAQRANRLAEASGAMIPPTSDCSARETARLLAALTEQRDQSLNKTIANKPSPTGTSTASRHTQNHSDDLPNYHQTASTEPASSRRPEPTLEQRIPQSSRSTAQRDPLLENLAQAPQNKSRDSFDDLPPNPAPPSNVASKSPKYGRTQLRRAPGTEIDTSGSTMERPEIAAEARRSSLADQLADVAKESHSAKASQSQGVVNLRRSTTASFNSDPVENWDEDHQREAPSSNKREDRIAPVAGEQSNDRTAVTSSKFDSFDSPAEDFTNPTSSSGSSPSGKKSNSFEEPDETDSFDPLLSGRESDKTHKESATSDSSNESQTDFNQDEETDFNALQGAKSSGKEPTWDDAESEDQSKDASKPIETLKDRSPSGSSSLNNSPKPDSSIEDSNFRKSLNTIQHDSDDESLTEWDRTEEPDTSLSDKNREASDDSSSEPESSFPVHRVIQLRKRLEHAAALNPGGAFTLISRGENSSLPSSSVKPSNPQSDGTSDQTPSKASSSGDWSDSSDESPSQSSSQPKGFKLRELRLRGGYLNAETFQSVASFIPPKAKTHAIGFSEPMLWKSAGVDQVQQTSATSYSDATASASDLRQAFESSSQATNPNTTVVESISGSSGGSDVLSPPSIPSSTSSFDFGPGLKLPGVVEQAPPTPGSSGFDSQSGPELHSPDQRNDSESSSKSSNKPAQRNLVESIAASLNLSVPATFSLIGLSFLGFGLIVVRLGLRRRG